MSNVDTVKHVYDRFARGDAAAVLATFADNVEFRLAEGHPYAPDGKPWIGADEIAKHFFRRAGAEWEGWTIAFGDLIAMGDEAVVVECRYSAIFKPTGRVLDAQVCHLWRFNDGKIASFHQYLDTARLQKVMGYREP